MDNETLVLVNNESRYSESDLEKLFAYKAVEANPDILDNPFVFEKFVYVCNDIKPNTDFFEPPTVLHIAKAISTMKKLRPEHLWGHEIKGYIAFIAHDEGWVNLPEPLSFAQHPLELLWPERPELDKEQEELQSLKHLAVKMYLTESGKMG